jgi:predicted RecA/RadA family phage recombinase
MKNFIQPGKTVTVTAPANVSSGDLVVVGSLIGVAAFTALSGAEVEIDTEGVFSLPKVVTDVISQGEKLYWDSGVSKLTKTAGTGSKPLVGTRGGLQRRRQCRMPADADRTDRAGVLASRVSGLVMGLTLLSPAGRLLHVASHVTAFYGAGLDFPQRAASRVSTSFTSRRHFFFHAKTIQGRQARQD